MNIHLYKTKTPTKENINKKLTDEKIIENVVFKQHGSLDVLTPTVILNGFNDMTQDVELNGYNMLYIPKLKRYYFIDKMYYNNGLLHINCSCDSLYTFRSSIKHSTQYVVRQQNNANKYIVDNKLPIHSDNSYVAKAFGQEIIDKRCIHAILETCGQLQGGD